MFVSVCLVAVISECEHEARNAFLFVTIQHGLGERDYSKSVSCMTIHVFVWTVLSGICPISSSSSGSSFTTDRLFLG